MMQKAALSMGRYRAIMTETDRKHITGESDPKDHQVDQSVYRIRKRINEELVRDIEILEQERPDLVDELQDVVCTEDGE